jgi:hypothetical protein
VQKAESVGVTGSSSGPNSAESAGMTGPGGSSIRRSRGVSGSRSVRFGARSSVPRVGDEE